MSSELRRVILSKAEEEAKSIIARAEEEARSIVEEAKKLKEQEVSRERERVRRSVNYEARIAEARLKARMIVAEAKNEVLKKFEEYVWSYLNSLSPVQREQSLLNLMREAVKAVLEDAGKGVGVVVYVSGRDLEVAKRVANTVSREFGLEIDVRESSILGGVVVSTLDGRITVDNSYETRLRKAMASLLGKLREEVFG